MNDIKGYEREYGITSCGRVWSYKSNKFLKSTIDGSGYEQIMLCKNGKVKQFKVHRLVAEAYIPNPNNFSQVNHKDENKNHNWINNLEWCDAKYNVSYSLGLKIKCVETNKIYESIRAAAKEMNLDNSSIAKACKGKLKTCGGYHWRYI